MGSDVAGEPSGTVPRSESSEGGIPSPVRVTRRLPGRVSVIAEVAQGRGTAELSGENPQEGEGIFRWGGALRAY